MLNLFTQKSRKLIVSLAIFSTLGLTGCGGNGGGNHQVVSEIQVGAHTSGGDVIVDFNTLLDIGNLTLPTLMLPINHPKTGEEIGYIDLKATFDGRNEIGFELNVTNAFNANTTQNAKLPNGLDMPVGGLYDVDITNFPIDQNGTQIYLGLAKNVSLVGIAIPIKEFDVLGGNVGAVNFFARFDIEGVIGVAGMFTGASGQNGLGIFIDTSKYFDPTDIIGNFPLPKKDLHLAKRIAEFGAVQQANPVWIDQVPNQSLKRRLEREIYKLHKKRTQLHL